MKYIQILILTILLLVNFTLTAFSREISLYWEPSPSPGVIGYKVHYQSGTPQLPLTGTEANQGASPIDVENSLMATISGLQETVVYYFSVTAYDSNFNESTFSNIVSTAWMPPLRNPQKESIVVPWNVTFQWDAGPPEQYLNYTLYYGTDKNQVIYAGTPPTGYFTFPIMPWTISTQGMAFVIALALVLTILSAAAQRYRRTSYLHRTTVAGLFVVSLMACGGGGGGGDDGPDWTGESLPISSTALMSVNTGSSTSYQTDNLESGTTYYWKVDAHSTTEPDKAYHSEVYSFTTE